MARADNLYGSVSFSTIAANGYGAGDINSCAIQLNNLTTVGSYQYAAYYDTSRQVVIARRSVGSSTWQNYGSGLAISSADIGDDHNVIAMAVDSAGFMHLSYDMHNQSLKYAISSTTVTGSTLSSVAFTTQTAANAPTLFPNSGVTANEVTYPVFSTIPNSGNLLLTYRNGGAGGGSGNGDHYFNVYNPTTQTWTNSLAIDGERTNVNAYLNSTVYVPKAGGGQNLLASWTWRSSPAWQSNSNILFAQSPDNGATWYRQGGTTQYGSPIIQNTSAGGTSDQVAQVIANIPQNSSFINQTSMTADAAGNPLIATWLAPNSDATKSVSGSNNPDRQYMLYYYTGSAWKTSQVGNRTSDTTFDTSAADVRDLGRPIVLVDTQGRVLVVTRSEDTQQGSFANAAKSGNNLVIYWNTVASLDSANPAAWQTIALDTANMGAWEPTYDSALWASQNKLSLLYTPVGFTGQTTASVKVLQWDEQAYFAAVPEPGLLGLFGLASAALLRRRHAI